ncbi:hypothetical protein TNCV_4140571 [Trichonephila clavipes]|nr:hypothetical protein TNCV_4140571 [Trichonephila clavipes]
MGLVHLKGDRTGNVYLFHLENVVKPLIEDCFTDGDGIYQDDPGRTQTAQTGFRHNQGVFHHSKWLSKSLDIIVIENLWDEMERH